MSLEGKATRHSTYVSFVDVNVFAFKKDLDDLGMAIGACCEQRCHLHERFSRAKVECVLLESLWFVKERM